MCNRCGVMTSHRPNQYLAIGKRCNACGKTGHFARICRSKCHKLPVWSLLWSEGAGIEPSTTELYSTQRTKDPLYREYGGSVLQIEPTMSMPDIKEGIGAIRDTEKDMQDINTTKQDVHELIYDKLRHNQVQWKHMRQITNHLPS